MAGNTDSDDASEIFWPGYVDAVTNLAINLLFVIAVMSIVVIAVTMNMRKAPHVEATPTPPKAEKQGPADQAASQATMNEMKAKKEAAEKQVATLTTTVAQLQSQLQKAVQQSQSQSQSQSSSSSQSKSEESRQKSAAADASPTAGSSDVKKVEVVTASQKPTSDSVPNSTRTMTSGVLVVFSQNSVALEEAEATNLVKKMAEFAPVKTSRWRIEVIVPKGFSESLRLGYYRVNAVRNVLIQNGVPTSGIDMHVVESDQPSANNSRVLVRPLK